MKIGMILRRLNVKGGTQRQALSLAVQLRKKGHEVVIYTLHYDKEKCYPNLLEGFTVHVPPQAQRESERRATYYPAFEKTGIPDVRNENDQACKLARIMSDDFDILNPHDQVAYKVARYYKKYKRDIPSVWNMNDLPLKQFGYDRAHGADERFHQPWYKHVAYRIFDFYDKHAFIKKQDAIIVVDRFNKDLIRKYLKLNAFTVRSGPDFEYFPFKKKTPPSGNRIKILTSGILMAHRRFEDAIRAIPILLERGIDATLTIIGDTDNDKKYFSRLQALVQALNLGSRVTFRGRVTDEELIACYHDHDVYTFQHHLQSDGLSPFEAAACGMPLIVSKTAGCHEVLTDNENVLLIDPKNPRSYAYKVEMLARNPMLFNKMAESANAFVRANFSWEKYADGVLAVIEKVRSEGPQMQLKD